MIALVVGLVVLALVALFPAARSVRADEPETERPTPRAPLPDARPPLDGGRVVRGAPRELRAYVVTFSPGDHPFYKFGHNAIWIHDEGKPLSRRDIVYNYGTFSFEDPSLIPKFFLGRFMYWLSAAGWTGTKRAYKAEGRGIDVQELDLSPAKKLELQTLLDENLKDENKYYKYDYYRDNCSTRVRDMIDRVTGGRVKAAAGGKGRLTYRQHTSRLTHDFVSENVLLNLVMGDLIDKPTTEWDESFVPMEFQKLLRKVTVVGEDGVEHPIVKQEWTEVAAVKPPPPENPPTLWPYFLVFGLLFGGGFAALGRFGVTKKPMRVAYGIAMAVLALPIGFFGLFFLAAWAFTDHAVGYHNENTLLCVPWGWGLVGMGINIARGRVRSAVRAEKLIKFAAGSAILATVAKVLPWFDQGNAMFLLFFVPFWAGAYVGARALAFDWASAVEAAALAGANKKKKKKKKRDRVESTESAAEPSGDDDGAPPADEAATDAPTDAPIDAPAEPATDDKEKPEKESAKADGDAGE
ncbi:MAG: DUF4105 domain-containing protein [Polyangiaceae bacterium]